MSTERIAGLLELLYPGSSPRLAAQIAELIRDYAPRLVQHEGGRHRWQSNDAVLISYPDSLVDSDRRPLEVLADGWAEIGGGLLSTLHLLPFFPWSSDDGFSVSDYLAVNPQVGDWNDVTALRGQVALMFDAVINHMSASNPWFTSYLAGDPRFAGFAIQVEPHTDLSKVTRPRTSPLLTKFQSHDGPRWLWTTFSADQVDLNYSNPQVLLKVLGVLLEYVARGASVIRLDAIAFAWKQLGTDCIHRPQLHALVKLIRAVLDEAAPGVDLITETNVPHRENVSYFGDGHDEAQLVYNFSLPPLCAHAFVTGDATVLTRWAQTLQLTGPDVQFFNFLASHDGVGVRGAEGWLTDAQIDELAVAVRTRNGFVSARATEQGERPYELNINFFDLLTKPDGTEPLADSVRRFLTAHAILLALPGVPAIYIHSWLGSTGAPELVAQTGRPRSLNRAKLDWGSLRAELADPATRRARINQGLRRLLGVRSRYCAFTPGSPAHVLDWDARLFVIARGGAKQVVTCVHNVCGDEIALPAPGLDVITGEQVTVVDPYATVWLRGFGSR